MATDAPPSYHDVVTSLHNQAGGDPEKALSLATQLSGTELDVVHEAALAQEIKLDELTEQQKSLVAKGMVRTMSTEKGAEYLQIAAQDAVKAIKDVDSIFLKMTTKLTEVDNKHLGDADKAFAPQLQTIQKTFNAIVDDSRELAVQIQTYGERFDDTIIKIASDKNYSTDQRRAKVNEYVTDASTFAKQSADIKTRFKDLNSTFAAFTGTFDAFASSKESDTNAKLKTLNAEMVELKTKLGKLQGALVGVGVAAGLALPLTGIIACCSGPFAPFVIIGGLLVAGALTGAAIGLYAAVDAQQAAIKAKQAEIDEQNATLKQISSTKEELKTMKDEVVPQFQKSIDFITTFWQCTNSDALQISEWLKNGAKDADMPEYMTENLQKGVKAYKQMTSYLKVYADGILPRTQ